MQNIYMYQIQVGRPFNYQGEHFQDGCFKVRQKTFTAVLNLAVR